MTANKKGFTIAEVVISLAVITIVSLMATLIVISGQRIQNDSREEFYAVNLCENSLSVFRSAAQKGGSFEDICGSFTQNMEKLLSISPKQKEGASGVYTAELNDGMQPVAGGSGGAKYVCEFTFSAGTSLRFDVKITDSKGAELYSAYCVWGGTA